MYPTILDYRLSLTSNQFEIEVWMTHDKGLTWTRTPVTTHSKQVSKRKPGFIYCGNTGCGAFKQGVQN